VVLILLWLAVPAPASAEVVFNARIPFSATFFDECAGEVIQVTAEDHVVIRLSENSGTTFRDEHINSHGMAIGLSSGNEYIYNESIKISRVDEPGCGFTDDFSTKARFISQGSHPNLMVRLWVQMEETSGCVITTNTRFESACRG
jgi:hypothetical protein